MTISEFEETMNQWGHNEVPFLFAVDFEMKKPFIIKLDEVDKHEILFDINGFSNSTKRLESTLSSFINIKAPLIFEEYKQKFEFVFDKLCYGDSFLTNLTTKTEVELQHSLEELFHISKARYKFFFKDQFLVFSPEIFVQIQNGKIFSFPMKGTIDASMPNAREIIIQDKKELAEHVTIVDLIRNDLSQVASNVYVEKFRYIEEIKTHSKNLLQVSSKVVGELPDDYKNRLGTILVSLLPAGSISGAPKTKTIEIIKQAEAEERGYYTGVFGFFDGQKLDSGVMIRYIEKENNKYFYRSGGGITTQSVVAGEYREMIDKVYVPLD